MISSLEEDENLKEFKSFPPLFIIFRIPAFSEGVADSDYGYHPNDRSERKETNLFGSRSSDTLSIMPLSNPQLEQFFLRFACPELTVL